MNKKIIKITLGSVLSLTSLLCMMAAPIFGNHAILSFQARIIVEIISFPFLSLGGIVVYRAAIKK